MPPAYCEITRDQERPRDSDDEDVAGTEHAVRQ